MADDLEKEAHYFPSGDGRQPSDETLTLECPVLDDLPPPPPICPSAAGTTDTACDTYSCGRPEAWTVSPPPQNHYRPIRAPAIFNAPISQSIILSVVPHAEKVLILSPPFLFRSPVKRIQSPDDLRRFHASDSGRNFLGFVVSLSESIHGHKISDPCRESPAVKAIVNVLSSMIGWIDEIPPVEQPSRYGNLAYRDWHRRMSESEDLMLRILPDDLHSGTVEIFPYFTDSFGNSTRIDYGTGHETNFVAWLYCLARLGVVTEEDYQALVSRVFVKYLELMRKLQMVYWLEPAGSHGVWGLDDYHFLPFIFGSSQLIDHKYMKPKSIHNQDILDNFSNEYLYLSCVSFVKKVKKGVLAEHSPMLDDISGVATWNKVNSGMLKMYKAEVLEKVPIMQHFLFGWIIKWDE